MENYEWQYLYDENGDLSETVWTKGENNFRTKYQRKGEYYEYVSDNFKIVTNRKMMNVLLEKHDEENNVIYRNLYEDFDGDDNPDKRTTFRADSGTTVTEQYKRDEDGNLLEKNVYISVGDMENILLSTEVREIEYYE